MATYATVTYGTVGCAVRPGRNLRTNLMLTAAARRRAAQAVADQGSNRGIGGDKCRIGGTLQRSLTLRDLLCDGPAQLVPLSRHLPRLVCRQGPPHFECGLAT
jgi:hypothetical protein